MQCAHPSIILPTEPEKMTVGSTSLKLRPYISKFFTKLGSTVLLHIFLIFNNFREKRDIQTILLILEKREVERIHLILEKSERYKKSFEKD